MDALARDVDDLDGIGAAAGSSAAAASAYTPATCACSRGDICFIFAYERIWSGISATTSLARRASWPSPLKSLSFTNWTISRAARLPEESWIGWSSASKTICG